MVDDYALVLDSPLDRLGVVMLDGAVCRIDFLGQGPALRAPGDAAARRVARVLGAYFEDASAGFGGLPLAIQGTPFQQRVWQALRRIPVGEVRSYGALALSLGSGARAVANACRRNPLPLVIPCHRVVAAAGPGGYCGQTSGRALARKRWLLAHEAAVAS